MYSKYVKTRAEWNRVKSKHPIGKIVTGLKKREINSGILLHLSKCSGLIRNRELEWARRNHPDLLEGDDNFISAAVVGYNNERWQLELSLKELMQQEMRERLSNLKLDQIVVGTVQNFLDEQYTRNSVRSATPGVFVELEGGITGFLPRWEIPFLKKEGKWRRMDEILFMDDRVECAVDKVDLRKLRLRLKARSRKERWNWDEEYQDKKSSGEGFQESERRHRMVQSQNIGTIHEYASLGETEESCPQATFQESYGKGIVLIEDNFDVAHTVKSILEEFGHSVILHIENVEQARQRLQHQLNHFDFIIADVSIEGYNTGLRLAREFQKRQPNAQIIVITAHISEEITREVTEHSQYILCALQKPCDINLLDDLLQTGRLPEQLPKINIASSSYLSEESPPMLPKHKGIDALQAVYGNAKKKLENAFPDSKIAVIKLNLASGQFESIFTKGIDNSTIITLLYDLRYSPIADVIWNGETIFDSSIDAIGSKSYEKLRPVTDFSTFIGVPVKVYGICQYGIFLFRTGVPFSDREFDTAESTACMFGVNVERSLASRSLATQHNIYTIGSLMTGMYHELGNTLDVVRLKALTISNISSDPNEDDLERIRSLGYELASGASTLKDIVHTFLGLAAKERKEGESIKQILKDIEKALYPIARDSRVNLDIEDIDPVLDYYLFPGIGLRQSIFNVTLNGIQQVSESKIRNGFVHIRAAFKTSDKLPIKIKIEDNGNGIHEVYRDLVFNAFFTTRERGTGLGLYLARDFIQSLGGGIGIEETRRFGGTIFLIELPKPNSQR